MFSRLKFQLRLIAIVAVFVGLAGAFLGERIALAQGEERDYVDVGLILEVPNDTSATTTHRGLNIIVVNHGSRTAYDVEVVVSIEYPEDSSYFLTAPEDYASLGQTLLVPVGSLSQGDDRHSLKWSIPSLGGLQRVTQAVRVVHNNNIITGDTVKFDQNKYPHEHFGTVTTSSFESDLHKGNNTDRVWAYRYSETDNNYGQAEGNYTLDVSLDKPSPSPGDTVKFTINTGRERASLPGLFPQPIDLEVVIDLTAGLTVDKDNISLPSTNADSVTYDKDTDVFKVGTLKAGDTSANSVTLPITVASEAVVNEQCLTATLTGNPPPGVGPYDDDISDNVAKL